MQKLLPIIICAILLSLSTNCAKERSSQLEKEPMKKANLITSFGNYHVFEAPWNIQNEIMAYPDPNPNIQAANELMYFSGYAIKELILSGGYPNLVSDIASYLDSDNELILANFFIQNPQYYSAVQNKLSTDFGISYDQLLENAISIEGFDYGIILYLPDYIEGMEIGSPAIAMAVELEQPDSTSIAHAENPNNPADYYYDDDYIPAFYPSDDEFVEAAIGYDDYNEFKKSSPTQSADPGTAIIIVGLGLVTYGLIHFLKNNEIIIDPNSLFGSGNPGQGGNGCEAAPVLNFSEAKFDLRYQRSGQSRIRWKYYVNHPLDPKANTRGWDKKFKIDNPSKSQIGNIIYLNNGGLSGYDYTLTAPSRSYDPTGYFFLAMTYEHDWYAQNKLYFFYDPAAGGLYLGCRGRSKYANEYYQLMYVPAFNWCANGLQIWNRAGYAKLKGG